MVGTVKTDRFGEKFCQARTGIGRELAITKRRLRNITNFRFWLQADIQSTEINVCFTPKSGHSEAHAGLPLLTRRRHTGDEVYGHQAYRNSGIPTSVS